MRWERLDEDLEYSPNQLDRDVVALDQIRTVIKTFRDRLFTDIFPGRKDVPKTLIYAKDDSHAEDIVKIIREEFAKGNEFCQKITYKTTGKKPDELIAEFRFALHQEDELEPYAEHVQERFSAWLGGQEKAGKKFSEEQLFWLEKIKEHIVGSLCIDREDFEYTPFKEKGGIGKAYQLFGEGLWPLLDELNEVLAA